MCWVRLAAPSSTKVMWSPTSCAGLRPSAPGRTYSTELAQLGPTGSRCDTREHRSTRTDDSSSCYTHHFGVILSGVHVVAFFHLQNAANGIAMQLVQVTGQRKCQNIGTRHTVAVWVNGVLAGTGTVRLPIQADRPASIGRLNVAATAWPLVCPISTSYHPPAVGTGSHPTPGRKSGCSATVRGKTSDTFIVSCIVRRDVPAQPSHLLPGAGNQSSYCFMGSRRAGFRSKQTGSTSSVLATPLQGPP